MFLKCVLILPNFSFMFLIDMFLIKRPCPSFFLVYNLLLIGKHYVHTDTFQGEFYFAINFDVRTTTIIISS